MSGLIARKQKLSSVFKQRLKLMMSGSTLSITLMMKFLLRKIFKRPLQIIPTFEVNMITHGRGYLFGIEENYQEITDIEELPMVAEKGDDYE